jgi:hypothetical protein
MLEDQAVGGLPPESDVLTVPRPADLPVPDPAVVDSARLRIAAHRLLSAGQPADRGTVRPAEDIRAVHSVIDSAREDAVCPADMLDVGAALVVLSDLRLYLDGLEADLLDAAERVDLGWDVIAAIIGIPAGEAQRRHRALRARRDSQ